jgi:quercetin dioxygenase-like cupin family protein
LGTKEEGVETGVTHVPPGEGRSLWVLGELVTYKTTSEQTGGAYSLFEVTTQPGGGVPPHVQHREDESFWVLEEGYEFLIEGRTIRAGAGSLIYVPKGILHSHKNVGEEVGRMLVSQTPGGLYEHFFVEVGTKAVDGEAGPLVLEDQPNLERIVTIGVQYGIEILPPIAQRSRV